jgi:ABC-2 type transport system ATP-binding protein
VSNQLPAIEAHHLRRAYTRRKREPLVALDDVSLTIQQGSWLALLGPNGAGKSTLLRILATLDTPDDGSVRILGHDATTDARSIRRDLAVVFQNPGLDPLLTVRENLMCQGAIGGMAGTPTQMRINELAPRFGLEDRLHDRVGTLSGGLKRRVDLARALLSEPRLLLLDEPTTGLDHDARHEFLELLSSLHEETSLTIVMSTHLMDEGDRAQWVALINKGKLVQQGAPEALRSAIGGRLIRASLQSENILRSSSLEVAERSNQLQGVGSAEQVDVVARQLLDASLDFEVGPPTLADAYLHLTGTSLQDSGEEQDG